MIFHLSAMNFIYWRRNSPQRENTSATTTKFIHWLQKIIPLSQHFHIFGCFHISQNNIIHKRRNSSHKENKSDAADKKYCHYIFSTPKHKICCANGKFGLCSNRPKAVLRTDLSVGLTEKSVVLTDLVRCLKKLSWSRNQIFRWPNRFCFPVYRLFFVCINFGFECGQ
jgi:hypothetical protein